ncbi:MAG: hypothetical protein V2A79_19950 [Planctomycetota bacterium]
MTTRAGLNTIVRNQGIDATTWTDTEVNQFIADAIGEYNQFFPKVTRTATAGTACTADVHEYALPADFVSPLLVEFPHGEDPPIYLHRLARTEPRFGAGYYDIDGANLVIGEDPASTDKYELTYHAYRDYPDTDATVLEVPDEDLELLCMFVVWKAYRRLEIDEAKNPTPSSVILTELGSNTGRARFTYERAMTARRTKRPAGGSVSWG